MKYPNLGGGGECGILVAHDYMQVWSPWIQAPQIIKWEV